MYNLGQAVVRVMGSQSIGVLLCLLSKHEFYQTWGGVVVYQAFCCRVLTPLPVHPRLLLQPNPLMLLLVEQVRLLFLLQEHPLVL